MREHNRRVDTDHRSLRLASRSRIISSIVMTGRRFGSGDHAVTIGDENSFACGHGADILAEFVFQDRDADFAHGRQSCDRQLLS